MSDVDWNNVQADPVGKTEVSHNDGEEVVIPLTDPRLKGFVEHRTNKDIWSVFSKVVQKPTKFMTLVEPMEYQLVDPTLPPLQFATDGSAGLDLYNRLDETIPPFAMGYKIPLNVKIKISPQVWLMLAARSSFAMKHGLLVSNSVGIVDNDYREELMLSVFNPTSDIKIIKKGTRIAQIIAIPSIGVNYVPVDIVESNPNHTGFGSTGV